jgi:hypothetical protein
MNNSINAPPEPFYYSTMKYFFGEDPVLCIFKPSKDEAYQLFINSRRRILPFAKGNTDDEKYTSMYNIQYII